MKTQGHRFGWTIPVITRYPGVAADYLRVIKMPMDLKKVRPYTETETETETET